MSSFKKMKLVGVDDSETNDIDEFDKVNQLMTKILKSNVYKTETIKRFKKLVKNLEKIETPKKEDFIGMSRRSLTPPSKKIRLKANDDFKWVNL